MTEELGVILSRIMADLPPLVEPTPDALVQSDRETELKLWVETATKIGVPRRLWSASFGARLRSPCLDRVRLYAEGGEAKAGDCLVLAGPTGVGKSYAAVAALRAWESGGRRFLHFPALSGALLDSQRRAHALEAAKNMRFIVLDDFGAEYAKEGGLLEALVDEIICHREAEILPTIITTNLAPKGLKDRLSDRIVDRFNGGWGRVFAVKGPSLRSAAAAEPAEGNVSGGAQ